MDGIPLESISQVRTTANSIGFVWAAWFVALAERRGVDPNAFGIFIQNDVLKEYIARGTQIFPPEPSLRLATDVVEHAARHVPRWVPLAISGYHIREAGADAVQEIAFTFANAIAYLDAAARARACGRRGGADPVHVPVAQHRASSRRSRSSGPPGGCGRGCCASATRPATRAR